MGNIRFEAIKIAKERDLANELMNERMKELTN